MKPRLYHIVSPEWWAEFSDLDDYESETFSVEKFIHLSTFEQVQGTLNNYFVGKPHLLLLHLDIDALTAETRFEDVPHGGTFPHLYGRLNKSAITKVEDLFPNPDGTFTFPAE